MTVLLLLLNTLMTNKQAAILNTIEGSIGPSQDMQFQKKTPLPPEVPLELGQNEICLLLTSSYGHKEASEQTSPKVAAHLALPQSDKVEIQGRGPRGVLKARKTGARPLDGVRTGRLFSQWMLCKREHLLRQLPRL